MNIEFEEIKQQVQTPEAEEETAKIPEEIDYSKASAYSEDPIKRSGELLERLKLKSKILAYQDKFKEELVAYQYKMNQLDLMSNPDLSIFLEEIKVAVNTRSGGQMVHHLYFGGVNLVEKMATKMGYNLTGFSSVLKGQPDVIKTLNQISLEQEDNFYISPHVRLAYLTMNAMMMCYQVKKTEAVINNEIKRQVKKELTVEYQDL